MNIAFVPVRCNSKSIKLKNIKIFCGKPLVYWSLKALQSSKTIDVIYVATDCKKIISIVKDFNFSKVNIYPREKINATDTASTESVIIEFIKKNDFNKSDIFFLVQATSPFTQFDDFDKAFYKFMSDESDSLLTCVRKKRFFWNNNFSPVNYDFHNRPRRQDFEGILMENGAFYISRISNILKYNNRIGGKISIYEMEEYTGLEIDEENDWFIGERLMEKYLLNSKVNSKIKLFLSDVDGTLTDAGMYYGNSGEELKKFNTHDGMGFELLRNANIKTGLITSEKTKIVSNRAKKLKVDYLYQGVGYKTKLDIVKEICLIEKISLDNVAYIGDDINCLELLKNVGLAACPSNAMEEVQKIPEIIKISKAGGDGAVREFINLIIKDQFI